MQKENRPLSKCQISFPELPNESYRGCFEIHEEILTLWVDFDRTDKNLSLLKGLLSRKENFSALITDGRELGYSCFSCFALDDCNIFLLDFGLVKIFCNRWIEAIHIDSESTPFARKAYLYFPFIEYWFLGIDDSIFSVSQKYTVKCCKNIETSTDRIKCSKLEKSLCWFEIEFPTEKSLQDILSIEETLWLFIRFATNIPIPRAKICIPYSDIPERHYIYHFQSGHHPIIEDYANPSQYADIPFKLHDIVEDKDIFSKWDSFLHTHYHAIKMWSKEMGKTSLLDERISHYVQIIDSLTKEKTTPHLNDRIKQCLDKYAAILPFKIDTDTSKNLTQIRVSFSHFYDEKFISKDEMSGRKYLEYEKIVQKLIRVIINENLGLLIREI